MRHADRSPRTTSDFDLTTLPITQRMHNAVGAEFGDGNFDEVGILEGEVVPDIPAGTTGDDIDIICG